MAILKKKNINKKQKKIDLDQIDLLIFIRRYQNKWMYITVHCKFRLFSTTVCGWLSRSENSSDPKKSLKSIISSRPVITSRWTRLDGRNGKRPTFLYACISIMMRIGAAEPSKRRNIFRSRSKAVFAKFPSDTFNGWMVESSHVFLMLSIAVRCDFLLANYFEIETY